MIKRPLILVCSVAILAVAVVAHGDDAGAPPAPVDAQLARLEAAKTSLKWNWVPPGKAARYGHAEVLIDAPLVKVRGHVTDYPRYRQFAPTKFKTAKVVAKEGDNTDVYFRVPILKGLSTMSYVLRFGPAKIQAPGTERLDGKFISGSSNVKDVHLAFTLREVAPARTILAVDLLVVPAFPAPQEALDEELRDAAMNAVDAVRDQALAPVVPAPTPTN